MKTRLLVLFVLAMSHFVAFSQGRGNNADAEQRREEIRAQRVAFITERVNLTASEAQKFWPLYNEREAKKRQLNREVRQLRKGENVDYEQLNEARINAKIKEAELEKEYYLKFKTILSAEKIHKLYQAERDFQKELLGKIQRNPENRKSGNRSR